MQNIMARYTDPLLHTAERLMNGLAAQGLKTRYAKHHGKIHRPTFAHSRKTFERSGCPRLEDTQNIMARYIMARYIMARYTVARYIMARYIMARYMAKHTWQDTWQNIMARYKHGKIHGKIHHGKTSWQNIMARHTDPLLHSPPAPTLSHPDLHPSHTHTYPSLLSKK
jgi:hypothetical protein